jgi:hypothetical protein
MQKGLDITFVLCHYDDMARKVGLPTLYPDAYSSFNSARKRCRAKSAQRKNYYDRGILFCFQSFAEFLNHLGDRPKGLTLERKNNDGNYEIGNVKWATRYEQTHNRRNTPTLAQRLQNFTDAQLLSECKRRNLC